MWPRSLHGKNTLVVGIVREGGPTVSREVDIGGSGVTGEDANGEVNGNILVPAVGGVSEVGKGQEHGDLCKGQKLTLHDCREDGRAFIQWRTWMYFDMVSTWIRSVSFVVSQPAS